MLVYHRDPCMTLLYKFYANDLNYFMCNTTLRLYGDDTTEYASNPSPVDLQLILACYQAGLNLIIKRLMQQKRKQLPLGHRNMDMNFKDCRDVRYT